MKAAELDRLSAREREWYLLFLRGLGSKDIACRMGLSVNRVSELKASTMRRLLISTEIRLVVYGLRLGLLDDDGDCSESHAAELQRFARDAA